jgi:molecular chaperone DnaK (HSP70)
MAKMFKKEDELFNQRTKVQKTIKDIENAITNKQRESFVWEKKYTESKEIIATIEANGHPIDKQFERIQRALAKTLTKR